MSRGLTVSSEVSPRATGPVAIATGEPAEIVALKFGRATLGFCAKPKCGSLGLDFAFHLLFQSCCSNQDLLCAQNYVVLLDSTLPRSQYEYILPQVSFTAAGYHKHITLIFSPTVSSSGVAGQASPPNPALVLGWRTLPERLLARLPCPGSHVPHVDFP